MENHEDFEEVFAKAMELAQPAQEELNMSRQFNTTLSQIDTGGSKRPAMREARFGANPLQVQAGVDLRNAAPTEADTWAQFKQAMETNLQYLSDGSGSPVVISFTSPDDERVKLQTGAVRLYEPGAPPTTKAKAGKADDMYTHLVPAVEITPHTVDWLANSLYLGDIGQYGHLINLPNSLYQQLRKKLKRVDITSITAHNGKFQVNYRTERDRYEMTPKLTKQYPSGYEEFLDELRKPSKSGNLSPFYQRAKQAFIDKKIKPPARDLRVRNVEELDEDFELVDQRIAGNQLQQLLSTLQQIHKTQEGEIRRAYDTLEQKEAERQERDHIVIDMHQGQIEDMIGMIGRSVNRLESMSLRRQMRQYLLTLMDAELGPARTPVIVPEKTATFKTQQSVLIESGAGDDIVMIGNHTAASARPMYVFKGTTATALMRTEAESHDAHWGSTNERLRVKLIPLGSISDFRNNVSAVASAYDSNQFSKSRLVASTAKIFKESKSDNESGSIFAGLYRNGIPVGDTELRLLTDRETDHSKRVNYAFQEGLCLMHSYRPQSEAEVTSMHQHQDMLADTWANRRHEISNLRMLKDFSDEPVLFAQKVEEDLGAGVDEDWRILTYDQLLSTSDTDDIALVAESLTNRQTFMHHFAQLREGSVIRVKLSQCFEGIVERDNLGLEMQYCQLGEQFSSAIDLARRVPIVAIIDNRDEMITDAVQFAINGQLIGGSMFTDWLVQTWDKVKEWGLDKLSKDTTQEKVGDVIEDLVRAALLAVTRGKSTALEPIVDQISPVVQRAIKSAVTQ